MIVFVLSFTAIILPAVFTWITVKEAADKAYNKGYQNGYSRAFKERRKLLDLIDGKEDSHERNVNP